MYRFHAATRRIDWLYKEYGGDAARDVRAFVALVNEVYYKHFASVYCERYVSDIEAKYTQLFRSLALAQRSDWNIIDIGGGLGFEYEQFVRNNIAWNDYYFIEPDAEMIRQFEIRHDFGDRRPRVLQGRLEDFTVQLERVPNKLCVFNSCLHHVIWVETVLDIIKSFMHPGDYLLICHEPNNAYLGSPLMVANYVFRCLTTDLIPRKLGFYRPAKETERQKCWQSINDELMERGVICRRLPPIVTRRIIDYGVGVKGDWKSIRVPKEFDEGHWTPRELMHYMGTGFRTRFLQTYRSLGDPSGKMLWTTMNALLDRWFPQSGSVFSMAMQRV